MRVRQLAVLFAIGTSACSRAHPEVAPSVTVCQSPNVDASGWTTLFSPQNGIAMSHPVAYVDKQWSNRGTNNPAPSAVEVRELWSKVSLWLDNSPVSLIEFGMARSTTSSEPAASGPVRTCEQPSVAGTWHTRLYTTPNYGATGRSGERFVVTARLAIPGDSLLLQFVGITRDSVERERQIATLGTFRLLPR